MLILRFRRLWALCLLCLSPLAAAYQWRTAFNSEHYALNEVILEGSEQFNPELGRMLEREIARTGKLQSVTAVFPAGSPGLKGTVKEPLAALITAEAYTGRLVVSTETEGVYAADAGIPLTSEQLQSFADHKTTHPLITELSGFPLSLHGLKVRIAARDFEKRFMLTASEPGFILDIRPVDSLFVRQEDILKIRPGCVVDVLAVADRFLMGVPFFMALHASISSVSCDPD